MSEEHSPVEAEEPQAEEPQRPSLGLIVHYTFADGEDAPNNSHTVPAIITAVFGNGLVNLRIFADQETSYPAYGTRKPVSEWRTSVPYRDNVVGEECHFWSWPERV